MKDVSDIINYETLGNIVSDVYNKKKKIIGWGASGYFKTYNNLFKLDLDYIIDSDPNKWGKTVDRFIVKSPEVLKNEDINNIIIVLYVSALIPVKNQIKRDFGDFVTIQAPLLFGYNTLIDKRRAINDIINNGCGEKKKYTSENGIVIQGPVFDEVTLEIVKYYAALYPNDCIIFSTWNDSNLEVIGEIEKFVDYCILNEKPEFGGTGNRNYQIVSTYAGMKKAKELGLKYVLKARSDMLICAKDFLNQCINLQKLYEDDECTEYGAKGRLIIPSTYTSTNRLYFTTDFAMFGKIDDVLNYWGIPLEPDHKGEINPIIYAAEMFFGRSYCKTLGWKIDDDITHWWDFCRKFFIVEDDKWFDLFWYKHPIIPSAIDTDKAKENISHYFWQSLYFKKEKDIKKS